MSFDLHLLPPAGQVIDEAVVGAIVVELGLRRTEAGHWEADDGKLGVSLAGDRIACTSADVLACAGAAVGFVWWRW